MAAAEPGGAARALLVPVLHVGLAIGLGFSLVFALTGALASAAGPFLVAEWERQIRFALQALRDERARPLALAVVLHVVLLPGLAGLWSLRSIRAGRPFGTRAFAGRAALLAVAGFALLLAVEQLLLALFPQSLTVLSRLVLRMSNLQLGLWSVALVPILVLAHRLSVALASAPPGRDAPPAGRT